MSIKEFQVRFKDFLQDLRGVNFEASPVFALNIYKTNYFSSLTKAIKSKFPHTVKYLSENPEALDSLKSKSIQSLLYNYIAITPSKDPNLDEYGHSFLEFIKPCLEAYRIAQNEFNISH